MYAHAIFCDRHPCGQHLFQQAATTSEPQWAAYAEQARRRGWYVDSGPPGLAFCPAHLPAPATQTQTRTRTRKV